MATPAGATTRLGSSPYNIAQISRLTPEQQQLAMQGIGAAGPGISGGIGYLSNLLSGSPESFADFEAPALRKYQQLLGNIGARYSGMGTGAQRSSGFKHELSGAATDLSERLAAHRAGMKNQAARELFGLYGQLMQPQFESLAIPREKPWYEELFSSISPLAGQILPMLLSGGFL